ncbi:YceI family protein [Thalassobellus sediminis]|uniref:YceI family protein n=1 Tax=Thalassobellus sediminis TaxID=3367753 RepID=UPI00378D8CF4
MKKLLYAIAFISLNIFAQEKYLTKTGQVTFEASVPSFEEVKATNNSVTAIINSENGELAALILVKGFRFKNALMEEHFNENYAESDTYPKATFKGKINNFSINKLSESTTRFNCSGMITFHGKTKSLESTPLNISISNDGNIIITGTFKTNASDYDIKIPKIVKSKISEDIEVSFNFKLKKK